MPETVNIHETDGGSVTVGLPDFSFEDTRRKLIAKRVAVGPHTYVGRRCSNLIEQLDNFQTAEGDQRTNLAQSIKRTMGELASSRYWA